MIRGAVTVAVGAIGVGVVIAACGGKVDGVSQGNSTPTAPATGKRPGGGSTPTRPPAGPASAASIAAEIAATYCKTFSSCCVGAGQPPIDVSRCREVITQEAMAVLETRSSAFDNTSVNLCVDAIGARMSICGKQDVAWQIIQGTPALFASSKIQDACEAVVGRTDGTMRTPCGNEITCSDGYTCAVDSCAPNPGIGGACANIPCLDGFVCTDGTCATGPNHAVDEMCVTDDDCLLGLVCAKGACAPAREHPDLYKRRSSPYRVGADTCKAFTYL